VVPYTIITAGKKKIPLRIDIYQYPLAASSNQLKNHLSGFPFNQ
jgi:hypothetical protein